MHEVALATQLSEVVARHTAGRHVTEVHIEVGALRQVVPETLAHAWGFVVRGTQLGDARLAVDWIDAEMVCANGHHTRLDASLYLDLTCPQCPAHTRVVRGEEFRVIDVEVD